MKFLISLILAASFLLPSQSDLSEDIKALDLVSENYILYSIDTDEVLVKKNHDIPLKPASILKILTTITALEHLSDEDLNTYIKAEPHVLYRVIPGSSTAGFTPYQELTIKEILYGVMLPSGADATALIAHYIADSEANFVALMNEKAKAIGMNHTQVQNVSGLDHPDQNTTLEDLLLLVRYALENEQFVALYTTPSITLSKYPDIKLQNHILNQSHNNYEFMELYGAKSGFTYGARRSLSSIATNENTSYIFISTQANPEIQIYVPNEALKDAIKVYTYMFEHFKQVEIVVEEVPQTKLKRKVFPQGFEIPSQTFVLSSDIQVNAIEHRFEFDENLKVPIAKGSIVGKHKLVYEDQLLETLDIVASQRIGHDPLYYGLWVSGILIVLISIHVIKRRKRRKIYRVR